MSTDPSRPFKRSRVEFGVARAWVHDGHASGQRRPTQTRHGPIPPMGTPRNLAATTHSPARNAGGCEREPSPPPSLLCVLVHPADPQSAARPHVGARRVFVFSSNPDREGAGRSAAEHQPVITEHPFHVRRRSCASRGTLSRKRCPPDRRFHLGTKAETRFPGSRVRSRR